VSQETSNRSFDELARGLASGTLSRGKAIRLMGAALLGGALASFPGTAWAAKGGRSSCAHFCQSLFGANTPEEAECVSAAKSGEGPCYTCTTAGGCGPSFTKPTCSVTGQTYHCSTCQCECPTGQEVCGGRCGTSNDRPCTANDQCCSGICSSIGFCLGPGHPSRLDCGCVGFGRNACITDCSDPQLQQQICNSLCGNESAVVTFCQFNEDFC
jgi:hypothetical protein